MTSASPPHALHEVRIEVEVGPTTLTIVERRAPWRPEVRPEWSRTPVARLRYTARTKLWTLYWQDRHLAFHLYDLIAPSHSVEPPARRLGRRSELHLLGLTLKLQSWP